MPLLNPSFEDAGALPGEATGWTLRADTRGELLAGFGAAPEEACESFERWYAWLDVLAETIASRAFFDEGARGYESFAPGWRNGAFLEEMPQALLVALAFGGTPFEDCEHGWLSAPLARSWDEVDAEAGLFGGQPYETLEHGWRSNETFASSWADVTASAARFDASAVDFEGFESAWPHAMTQ